MIRDTNPMALMASAVLLVVLLVGGAAAPWFCLTHDRPRQSVNATPAIAGVAERPGAEPVDPISFNRDIRPILSDKCFACHGPDHAARKADLRLDTTDDGAGFDGAYLAIEPGDPGASELVTRIFSEKSRLQMPPPAFKRPLTDDEKALLVAWIEQGATYEPHWSFMPIVAHAPPQTPGDGWSRNALDRFVYARLAERGIAPAPEADRVVWLRRVTQDLTGLPPTVGAIDAFVADDSPNAYEKVVDRLLASDDYAERMALVWLDNARYADSNGFQFDNARQMWPWRDWVISAFKQNLPYDQFITEQLAGDLLPGATEDQRIATGFNRNHPTTIEGGIIEEEYRVMNVNDRTTTFGTLFLGLTLDCARCHDHKYDPVSMTEYYQLYAFFNSSADAGKGVHRKPVAPFIERDGGRVMVMQEQPRDTFVLMGGQFDQYGEKVDPNTPAVLHGFGDRPSNRLGLARWLFDDAHPLTARVTVNRLWQQFFGIGLVKTPDNLGLQAETPSHPRLLDYLAADFRDHGWDLHRLIKTIVLSATYRQDSTHRRGLQDPDNRLLARGPSFRLPAELIRDQALFASGLLTRKVGGPSVFPYQPDGIWEDLNAPASHAERYTQSQGEDLYRKSLYTYWRRAATHPAMTVFDAPSRDVCTVKRETTNTPLQALATLHDPTYIESARKLAERVMVERPGDEAAQVALAMRHVLSRPPNDRETRLLVGLYRQRLEAYRSEPAAAQKLLAVGESPVDATLDPNNIAALADVCLAIFNLSETLTRK
ncbi:MAG: PSD1 and planctomycete cytochrome C domain-containing protein [Phycisphaeraceae bacterium]